MHLHFIVWMMNLLCAGFIFMNKRTKELQIGIKINKFTVLGEEPPKYYPNKQGSRTLVRMVKCKCECGVIKIIGLGNLLSGRGKSCGCMPRIGKIQNLSKHPLYWVWVSMKDRCYNKNHKQYDDYGGRGVRVCEEWLNNFMSYYKWCMDNGWKKGLDIDKDIKGDGLLYSPNTCSIVTRMENMGNTRKTVRVNINGVLMSIKDICEITKAPYSRIQSRIKLGVTGEKLFDKPKSKSEASLSRLKKDKQ